MTIFNTYSEAKAVMMHEFRKGNQGSVFQAEGGWAYRPAAFQAAIPKPLRQTKENWDYTAIK